LYVRVVGWVLGLGPVAVIAIDWCRGLEARVQVDAL
jgi:hypothetical protein